MVFVFAKEILQIPFSVVCTLTDKRQHHKMFRTMSGTVVVSLHSFEHFMAFWLFVVEQLFSYQISHEEC